MKLVFRLGEKTSELTGVVSGRQGEQLVLDLRPGKGKKLPAGHQSLLLHLRSLWVQQQICAGRPEPRSAQSSPSMRPTQPHDKAA